MQISREQINSELFARLMALKAVAEMFESIPLGRNRHRLRMYRKTFRGNEAVDFILESKIAASRREATKVLRDLQIQFRLFEHVTKEHNFRDDRNSIFRFVDQRSRRMWDPSTVPFKYIDFDEEKVEHILPFSLNIFFQEFIARKQSVDQPILVIHGGEICGEPAKLAHASIANVFVKSLESRMLSASNVRVQAVIDPDLVREIHGLEVSVDSLHANPGYTSDDWYEKLGFVGPRGEASEQMKGEKANSISLPHMYIPPFHFQLSLDGVIIAAKATSIRIDEFSGDEQTTSNDLISYFVMRVLSRAPGLLGNLRVLGVNVMEKSGVVSALTFGAKIVPFGEYLSLGGMAVYDGVTMALDNGKYARDDAGGNYKVGDFVRGVVYSANEAARNGAKARGKVDDIYYDEEDEVKLDTMDFAVGVAHGTAKYAYSNKARFAGATVASASFVALTVATGPVAGIFLGIVCGVVAEKAVEALEKKFEKRADVDNDDDSAEDVDEMHDTLDFSELGRDTRRQS